jgi:hypothetical protein
MSVQRALSRPMPPRRCIPAPDRRLWLRKSDLRSRDGRENWTGASAIVAAVGIAIDQELRDPNSSGVLCGGADPSPAHTCPLMEPPAPAQDAGAPAGVGRRAAR